MSKGPLLVSNSGKRVSEKASRPCSRSCYRFLSHSFSSFFSLIYKYTPIYIFLTLSLSFSLFLFLPSLKKPLFFLLLILAEVGVARVNFLCQIRKRRHTKEKKVMHNGRKKRGRERKEWHCEVMTLEGVIWHFLKDWIICGFGPLK